MKDLQASFEAITNDTNSAVSDVNNRLKNLQKKILQHPPDSEQAMWKNQHAAYSKKFLNALTEYQNVQRQNRNNFEQRFTRQYHIVNPYATEEEIQKKIREGVQGNIFAGQVSII